MQSVGTKNTGPEVIVRRLLHRLGYRFSLHRRSLPGSPDIVLRKHKTVIFVHGCFWHGHGCDKGRLPKSRLEYWSEKIDATKRRDAATQKALTLAGWEVVTVWQCEAVDLSDLERTILARVNRRQ